MPTRTLRSIRPHFWIPPDSGTVYKIEIEDKNGNIIDITDEVYEGNVEDYINESIGIFDVKVPNGDEKYNDIIVPGKEFRYYKEYTSGTATNKVFTGIIEKPSFKDNIMQLTGRSISGFFQDITVTKQFADIDASEILKQIVSVYGQGKYSTNHVETTGILVTVNWYQKKFWECVEELRSKTGFDVYIDAEYDFNFFESGSRDNDTDGIASDVNLIGIDDFADDIALIRNRVIVYGAQVGGVQILYTAEDTTSQDLYGVKEEIINDDGITSYDQAVETAESKLDLWLDPPEVGDVTGTMLATVLPGENVHVSSPEDSINPNLYPCVGYKDDIASYTTTLVISNQPRTLSHVMREVITKGENRVQASFNPEELRYAYTLTFDEDSGTHTNTEISNGVLRLQTGQSSGTWISDIRSENTNVLKAYLITIGTLSSEAVVEITANGIIYTELDRKTLTDLGSSVGTNLQIKITLTTGIEIDSLNLLYNRE